MVFYPLTRRVSPADQVATMRFSNRRSLTAAAAARVLVAVSIAGLASESLAVESLQALALTRDRAILSVDGERRVLRIGQVSPEGVELVESNSAFAIVRIDGREQRLQPGPVTAPVGMNDPGIAGSRNSVVLWADPQGFFHADGAINGRTVRFLIDTGANTVAMSSRTARDIGLDLSQGQRGVARTASGIVGIVGVKLDEVTVGSITLYNVSAGVVDGDHPPQPLLGASFLNQVNMNRNGQRMELIRK
ncbi:MAG: TIGR02281 family clan AA aspartic protease [Proteobacteria bacterium]|nr:MAG: TIGR02281 family clan AA aspartic protease [Pseudomonadota bacterium]